MESLSYLSHTANLPVPLPLGRRRNDWHIAAFISAIAINITPPHIYPTHTHTRTTVTLPLMTLYTADKISRADSVTSPQKVCWEKLSELEFGVFKTCRHVTLLCWEEVS